MLEELHFVLSIIAKMDDDPNALPKKLQSVYLNPYKVFGLYENDVPSESVLVAILRDRMRRAALGQCRYFWGLPQNKVSLEEVLFAYHLLRRTIVGPAQNIAANLKTGPYMNFRPEDLLPTLRPLHSTVDLPSTYRAFRNLNVSFSRIALEMSFMVVPNYAFVFNIHYCLRKHTVQRSYAEVRTIYNELREELLTVPEFPIDVGIFSLMNASSRDEIGNQLASFLQRVHDSLAESGRFSPRFMRFLDIDVERVHSEEEGAIMHILDGQDLPPRSCWYIVDEKWLAKWRRFVMGRGPRRYLPPGPITNEKLAFYAINLERRPPSSSFDETELEAVESTTLENMFSYGHKWLEKVKHYRCVNCNVWTFYHLVHGGGPVISRIEPDIYSAFAVSFLQGVVLIQTRVRMHFAWNKKEELYTRRLSRTRAAQAVLSQELVRMQHEAVTAQVASQAAGRLSQGMIAAAQLTQKLWRKKNQSVSEEKLAVEKQDQAIFRRSQRLTDVSRGLNEASKLLKHSAASPSDDASANLEDNASAGSGVMTDVIPTVHIGNTRQYTCVLPDDDNFILPFKVRKLPWMEMAIIADSTDGHFIIDSKILSVNGHSALTMTYDEVMFRLSSRQRPMTLVLERPLDQGSRRRIDDLLTLTDERLRYSAFKVLLSQELLLLLHGSSGTRHVLDAMGFTYMSRMEKPCLTRVILTETDLYYKKRLDLSKKQSELWNTVPLYSIKVR